MDAAIEHSIEFAHLVRDQDDAKCVEYIDKYDDFYDIVWSKIWGSLRTPLLYACYYSLEQTALKLIHRVKDINFTFPEHFTPLMCACCYYGNENTVAELVRKGADINAKCLHYSALSLAYSYNKEHAAITLIKAGAEFADIINTDSTRYGNKQINQCIRDKYQQLILSIIDTERTDESDDNAMAVSFRTTYAVGVVGIISDFII
ncbi:MAG: hypothetical protein Faunusvirus2_33 [Faunusvirus sp.]|jgi:ankyrin repeat protein|uniref:Uncharacterized protein n=1 Tax=Faunusvirus sp. TaxID=2487766 RepID=A0A3G4ZW26_9VIRU|nr:MAG: hypothetical protein Faunusvirus2_33 [Faunusvirus sp.]